MIRPYYHETNLDFRFSRAWEIQKEKCELFDSVVEIKTYIRMFNTLTEWEKTRWFMWVSEFENSFPEAFENVRDVDFPLLHNDKYVFLNRITDYINDNIVVNKNIKRLWNAMKKLWTDHTEIDDDFIDVLEDANVVGEFVNPATDEVWYYYKDKRYQYNFWL